MRIYRFGPEAGKPIDQFGSINLILTHIVHLTGDVHVNCMYLGECGVVGYHQAVENQLFLVVEGKGWVRGAAAEFVPISKGQAAFWEAGEWHASRTDSGMTALVIEAAGLKPRESLPEA